jgi:hypothetical protein
MKTYAIHWKCGLTGTIGTGSKLFERVEAERLATELNKDYPNIVHEAVVPVPHAIEPAAIEPAESRIPSWAKKQRNMPDVNFTDTQLQACFELSFAGAKSASDDLRHVHALIATYDWFSMIEGPHSSRVHETIDHLIAPGLRPGLHRWYRRSGANPDAAAIKFRDYLSQLTGEKFADWGMLRLNRPIQSEPRVIL